VAGLLELTLSVTMTVTLGDWYTLVYIFYIYQLIGSMTKGDEYPHLRSSKRYDNF